MELIAFIQVFNIIVIAIGTLFYMCCRSLTFSSSSSSAVDSAVADCAAVADDEDADIPPRREKYDVFISFRGEDTRLGFTSHLHAALLQKKIETYIDNRLQRGEEIGPALLEAIEKSTISVIIFSQNYASSAWCLDEVVHILKRKERYGQMVVPVFYDINPSHVRKQHGSYADAFAQLEKRFDNSITKVREWRDALTTAANLSGFDYSNKSGTEADLVQKVVDHIWIQLCRESSCDLNGFVGIESRIKQIELLLGIHSQDACITVGIWGMGGIGKTTLAEAVFRRHSSKFEASCFLKNVTENSEQAGGLDHLEKTLLKEILKEEVLPLGSTLVQERLSRTEVLIVLDDVSSSKQMERLAGDRLRYGPGSRIIITSRDRSTLGQTVKEDYIYEVEVLKPDDALELFCSRAFKNNSTRRTDYKESAENVVQYARCVPLALTVLGSLFFNCKSKEDWEDEFNKLKRYPSESIQKVLRISYDRLEINEKEIFLDIACFFKGMLAIKVKRMLDVRGFFATAGIRILIDMSLISIDSKWGWEAIEMHDLLQEMGRTIVQKQFIEDPCKCKRLFNEEQVYRVLKSNTETPNVGAVFLDWRSMAKRPLKHADFKVMSNLKLLIVNHGIMFNASLDLPDSLRYLEWWEYPLESLPSTFSAENLVELHMSSSKVKKLWKEEQILVNLQVIDLSFSMDLTEVPNLSGSLEIVKIHLEHCTSLVEIPSYFRLLDKLTHLHLSWCSNLKYLPEMPGSIQHLDLLGTSIKKLPESVWSNENISYLNISHCSDLEKLPSNSCKLKASNVFGIVSCTSLGEFSELPQDITKLSLVGCKRLVSLPNDICKLKYLEELDLSGCSGLENFPEILEPMEHLKFLNLSGTAVKELPSSIEFLPGLKIIQLKGCYRLSSIPKSICKLKCLEELDISGCFELESFPEILEPMEHLKFLILSGTAVKKLPSSIEFLPGLEISQKKIETYIDNRLQSGEEIGPALRQAIEKSTISVIIFSQNYASSAWCLDELVHILECKKRYGHMVIPVFYDINPSDVRKQHGSYANAFARLEKRFDISIHKVHKWRDALMTAANLFGFDYSNKSGTEADLIQKVVDHIWIQLCRESSFYLNGFVGIESRIKQIELLLGIHSQDACITVGIWGTGGIGKTTLAEAVFRKHSSKFEASCFLKNVTENSEQAVGLDHLEKTLLKEILKEEVLPLGSTLVRERLSHTKVLIVLDDVSSPMQMERLAGDRLRYGPGSRIIITSKDRSILRQTVEEDYIYEVEKLYQDEALELFYSRAFKNNSTRRIDYKESADKVVAYAVGVPLALTVLTSLFCKSKEDWDDEFNKLNRRPYSSVKTVLRISYDRLEINEKEIFLDIACFFKGRRVDWVSRMIDVRGLFAESGIRILINMSLISIDSKWGWEAIEMHDLLQKMGRTIVQEQFIEDPCKWKRLFNEEQVYRVLKSNTETPNVGAVFLDWRSMAKRPLKHADFKVMSNLKLLIVNHGIMFNASLDLPDSLRYLEWWGYPLESLPSTFSAENLVELHMVNGKVKKLWKEEQILVNLQVIDLGGCSNLTEVPNLSGSLKIVKIILWSCISLVEIPSYFRLLDKLTHLDLRWCSNLKYLPEMPGSIRYLDLLGTGIKKLPESVWSNENISYLNISHCRDLEKLPSNSCKLKASNVFGIASCTSLGEFSELPQDITKLSLVGCKRLVSLPNDICKLKYLEELDLSGCSGLENFPEILEPMEHLKFLNLSGTAVKELPSSIEFLPGLRIIQLKGCYRLSSIPKSICKLKCLEELDISGCGIRNFPEILEPMENLKSLIISRSSVEQLYTSIEFFPALENIELEGCNMLSCISKSMLKYVKRPDEYETRESDDHGSEASEIEDDADL